MDDIDICIAYGVLDSVLQCAATALSNMNKHGGTDRYALI